MGLAVRRKRGLMTSTCIHVSIATARLMDANVKKETHDTNQTGLHLI